MKLRRHDRRRVALLIEALAPARKTRVVDVGSNPIHDPPYLGLLELGGCEVWGFEPQEDALAALQARDNPAETYLPHAIGDGQVHELKICKEGGFTSLLEPSTRFTSYVNHFRRGMTVVDRVQVETKRLDDIADLPPFDLLKIDIQGAEPMVFAHGQRALNHAVAVITEVAFTRLYEGQPLLDEQMRQMEQSGFGLHKFMSIVNTPLRGRYTRQIAQRQGFRSQLVDGDAAFIRMPLHDTDLDSETLKHLAILADAVMGSHDLCLRCQEILLERGELRAAQIEAYAAFFEQHPQQATG